MGAGRSRLGALMRFLAGAAVAHQGREPVEGIDVAGNHFDHFRLRRAAAGQGSNGPFHGGFIRLASEPAPAACATSHLCHPGDRRDHHEHDEDEKNEFD